MYGMGFDLVERPLLQYVKATSRPVCAEKWIAALPVIRRKVSSLPYPILLVDRIHEGLFDEETWDQGFLSTKGDYDIALAGFVFEQLVQLRGVQKALRRLHPQLEVLKQHPLLHPYQDEDTIGNAVSVLTHHRRGDEVSGIMGQAEERWSEVIERVDDMCQSAQCYTEIRPPVLYGMISDLLTNGRTVIDIAQIISHVVRVNIECFVLLEEAAPLINQSDIRGGPLYTDEEFNGGMGTVSSMFTHEFAICSRARDSTRSAFVLPRLKKFNPAFYFWCVVLLSSFVAGCQLSGTPMSGVPQCTGPETGSVYSIEVYHVNGTLCSPDDRSMVFEILDPIDAAQYNCGNLTQRYLDYLATWNSTWVCGGNSSASPLVPSGPVTVMSGPYEGWSTDYQASTGHSIGLPRVCPPKFSQLVGQPEASWPFLGGSAYRYCGGYSRSLSSRGNVTGGRTLYVNATPYFGRKLWYVTPNGLGFPGYFTEDQDFSPDYSWKTPGCFDGWSNELACQVGSGSSCYQVNGPTSYEIDNVNYNPAPFWCPQEHSLVDPVMCYSGPNGPIDPECLSGQQSGMPVNGSEAYCLNNQCNVNSLCWCAYTVGREVVMCGPSQASRTLIRMVHEQTLDTTRILSRSPSVQSNMYLVWNQPMLRVSFVSSSPRALVFSKSGFTYLHECHGVSCEFEMPVSFYSESSYCYASSLVNGDIESTSQVWIEAAKWCKQYLSIWRIYPDWECLSDAQKAFSVLVLILVSALIIIAIPPLLTAVVFVLKTTWACVCLTGRSFRSSPVSLTVQNYFRGAYRSVLPTILLFATVMACQSGTSIGVATPVCSTTGGVSSCVSQFSGTIPFSYPGQSYCWMMGESDIGFELQYLYSKKLAVTTFLYHTSDWRVETESRFRCNQASCDSATCRRTDELKEPNPNGQLSNQAVITHTGPSGCFSVDESVQASIEHLCSGLNPNCIYWKSSLIPVGQDLACYRVSSIRTIPVFNLTILTDSSKSTQTIELSSAMSIGNITLESSLPVYDSTILPPNSCLVRGRVDDYLSVCSRVGFPESGEIGDIQSNFNLVNDSTSPVVYDPSIFQSVETHSKEVTVSVKPSPVPRLLTSGPKLPVGRAESAWWVSNDTLQGMYSGKVTFSLFVSSASFPYTRYVEEPCPVIEDLSCDGCYSCEAGATIKVTARSSCIDGVAKVTVLGTKDVETSMRLTQTRETKEIHFFSGESDPNVEVCIGKVCETVGCRLSEVRRLNDTVEVLVTDSSSKDPEESPSRWLEDIFNGLGSWWQWILVVLIVIGVVFLVVMISPMIVSTVLTYVRKPKVDQKVVKVIEPIDRSQMAAVRSLNYRYKRRVGPDV